MYNDNMEILATSVFTSLAGGGLGWLAHDFCSKKTHSSQDNQVKRLPVPKMMEKPRGTSSVFFGIHPQDPSKQVCKPAGIDGHIGVLGESSRGKTSGVVIPTMAMFSGPQFILDTKGGLAEKWKKYHRNSTKVLKEFRCSAMEENYYWIDLFEPMRLDGANRNGYVWDLAETIIPHIPGDSSYAWRELAQNLLAGALLYYFNKGLSFVDALTQFGMHTAKELVEELYNSGDSEIQLFVKELKDIEPKVLHNVGVDLKAPIRLLSTPVIRHAITAEAGREQLSLYEFAMGRAEFDVIFEAPDAYLEQLRPLLVLVITQLMQFLCQRPDRFSAENPPAQTLLLLDEFPRLGKMPSITDGLNTLRSRGVTFLLCMQSIASLESLYGDATSRVILDNLSYKVILGATDVRSAEYCSKLVGDVPVGSSSYAISLSLPTPSETRCYIPSLSVSTTKAKERRPYIYPHEFQTLKDVIIVSPNGTCYAKKYRLYPDAVPANVKKEVKTDDASRTTEKRQ